MNLFKGLTTDQILSFGLTFVLFNGYVVLVAASLASFYVVSKPRRAGGGSGVVRTAAVWHFWGLLLFMLAIVSTVWAAPAEKSFVSDTGNLFDLGDPRFQKILIGLLFAAAGVGCMLVGFLRSGRQKRAAREAAYSA
ncbi:MAG: hypothetical protein NVSMB29_17160 [Candidatus Dormibacteria bacterium]